jgi:hypothetical protein
MHAGAWHVDQLSFGAARTPLRDGEGLTLGRMAEKAHRPIGSSLPGFGKPGHGDRYLASFDDRDHCQ